MTTHSTSRELPKEPDHFWSTMQICLASGLLGPAAGGYLLGRNYQALGEPKKAVLSYVFGVLGFILLLLIAYFLPEDIMERIPHSMWAIPPVSVFGSIARLYQQEIVKEKIEAGGKRYSYWWWLALMASIGVILALFVVLSSTLAAFMS